MSLLPKNERVARNPEQAIKAIIYGAPGIGKTTFAGNFPEPLLISTDGNYVHTDLPAVALKYWQLDKPKKGFKNKEEELAWKEEAGKAFVNLVDELVATNGGGFKTIIVDLLEGVFDKNRDYHLDLYELSDEGDLGYGKGYALVRGPYLKKMAELFSLPINVIGLSHEKVSKRKNRLGVEYEYYSPELAEKVADKLSGTGYTLRAYWSTEVDETGTSARSKRMLALSPSDTRYGVTRLFNAEGKSISVDDIELDYETFVNMLRDIRDPEKVNDYEEALEEVKRKPSKKGLKKKVEQESDDKESKVIKKKVLKKDSEDVETKEVEPELIDETDTDKSTSDVVKPSLKKKPLKKKVVKSLNRDDLDEEEVSVEETIEEIEVVEEVKEVVEKKVLKKKPIKRNLVQTEAESEEPEKKVLKKKPVKKNLTESVEEEKLVRKVPKKRTEDTTEKSVVKKKPVKKSLVKEDITDEYRERMEQIKKQYIKGDK